MRDLPMNGTEAGSWWAKMLEIVFNQVTKAFDDDKGLFDFSVSVEEGSAFGLIGPAAAGKSTACV